jgi:uncharacterized spore protein YtfJ
MVLSENKMNDLLGASLDGIGGFTDAKCSIGDPIITPSGVTVIPVSKITVGYLAGGIDLNQKRFTGNQNFGGGGGSGASVTPIAFLTVSPDSKVDLIPISPDSGASVNKAFSLVENAPEIIKRIKDALT